MPNSALPGNTYLGDGQRTTSEMQDALDQVATWLNAAQAELNALTGTTFGEAAVRGVGTGATDLVQTSRLDTRLGTSGNLGTMAVETADDYLGKTSTLEYDGGSTTSVDQAGMLNGGAGLYIVKFFDSGAVERWGQVYWDGVHKSENCSGAIERTEADLAWFTIVVSATGSISIRRVTLNVGSQSSTEQPYPFEEIYKV